MVAMHLAEALGMLTNRLNGGLNSPSKFHAQPGNTFFIPAPSLQKRSPRFWTKNNAGRHPPRLSNSSFTVSQGMAELGSRS